MIDIIERRHPLHEAANPGDHETRQGEGERIRWLPVELREVPEPVAGPALTLVLSNGLRLEVGADFEPRTLRRVLAVLQEPLAA